MTVYLDNCATTRPHDRVIEKMVETMRTGYHNPSALYAPAVDAMRAVRACREELLARVKGDGAIFTSGGTEANNLAILGASQRLRGDLIAAVSAVEHSSARQTYESLRARGADVRVIGVNETGEMDMESLERALADGARLVSVMHVNGETGAVSDIPAIHARIAGRALLHVDGVQGFLRVPFDMKSCDLYSVSAHKILGPKGVGALIYRGSVKLAPLAHGGGQEDGLRSGTEDTPGIAGFREAMRVMAEIDLDDMMATKMHLIRAFQTAVPSACINGPDPKFAAPHIVNMSFPGVRGEVMLHALEADGIYVSTGAACSSKKQKVSAVLTAMGIPQSRAECALRFSISPYTTRAEIDVAAESLQKNYERLKRFQRR